MKKLVSFLLVLLVLSSSFAFASDPMVTMYAPDGRTISIAEKEVEAYSKVGWYANKDDVTNAVLSKVKDGDIVLMHDIHATTAAAAERIIPELLKRGFQLVTVDELAKYKGKTMSAQNMYTDFR